ncbi:MAG: hypothetical protein RIS86_2205 [Planctomycetota bacterium]|jgi:hypothetical protein
MRLQVLRTALAAWLLLCGCQWSAALRLTSEAAPAGGARTFAVAACCCACGDAAQDCGPADATGDDEDGAAPTDPNDGPDCTGDCCVKLFEPPSSIADARDAGDLDPGRRPSAHPASILALGDASHHRALRRLRAPPDGHPPPPRSGRHILLEHGRMQVGGAGGIG